MTPLTDDEVRWLVNSHTCSQEMVGDTCRVCWLANERDALLAERDALKAALLAESAHYQECSSELAALRDKAERLRMALTHRDVGHHAMVEWCDGCRNVRECLATDFLTTSATESREAKGDE